MKTLNLIKPTAPRFLLSVLIGLVICFSFILPGCGEVKKSGRPHPKDYACNEQQLKLVAEETRICSETSYFSDFCFAIAKATICDKIDPEQVIDNKEIK